MPPVWAHFPLRENYLFVFIHRSCALCNIYTYIYIYTHQIYTYIPMYPYPLYAIMFITLYTEIYIYCIIYIILQPVFHSSYVIFLRLVLIIQLWCICLNYCVVFYYVTTSQFIHCLFHDELFPGFAFTAKLHHLLGHQPRWGLACYRW